jgi:hypothetical protein
VVLDIYAGHPVAGRRHDEAVVKAHLQWARFDLSVPIGTARVSQAQVPFADRWLRLLRT